MTQGAATTAAKPFDDDFDLTTPEGAIGDSLSVARGPGGQIHEDSEM